MSTSEDAAATPPPELPKPVALLWGLAPEGGERGPKRGLTLAQILDTAIALADAEGAPALSMSRVAKELGVTAMSLYRYVDSKQTLVTLVQDRVIGKPPAIEAHQGWRAGLRAWALAEFDVIARHSWYLDAPMAGPPMGPNNMAWLEAGLATLGRTKLPESVRLQLVMNLSLYVLGRSWAAKDIVADQGEDHDFEGVMLAVLDPRQYPALTSALADRAFDVDMDWERADFEFGLDRMLDGYEHYLGARGFQAREVEAREVGAQGSDAADGEVTGTSAGS